MMSSKMLRAPPLHFTALATIYPQPAPSFPTRHSLLYAHRRPFFPFFLGAPAAVDAAALPLPPAAAPLREGPKRKGTLQLFAS